MRGSTHTRRMVARGLVAALVSAAALPEIRSVRAGSLDSDLLERELLALATDFDGRVGVCVRFGNEVVGVNQGQRFPMQSVVKLVVAAAALDAVGRRGWSVMDLVLVRREDLSLYFQPIALLVSDEGYWTTLGDLIVRAVADSDSAANDILFRRLGGAVSIQEFLSRNGIFDIQVDRQERDLQTEIAGTVWRPEDVDATVLQQDIDAVPPARADAAFTAALTDERDSATPEGMAELLQALVSGALLSPTSTAFLLAAMERTWTGLNRLTAGLPAGWTLGNKTGTGTTRDGVNLATNDVGILTAPDGGRIAVVVFVSGSSRSLQDREALIASVAEAVTSAYS